MSRPQNFRDQALAKLLACANHPEIGNFFRIETRETGIIFVPPSKIGGLLQFAREFDGPNVKFGVHQALLRLHAYKSDLDGFEEMDGIGTVYWRTVDWINLHGAGFMDGYISLEDWLAEQPMVWTLPAELSGHLQDLLGNPIFAIETNLSSLKIRVQDGRTAEALEVLAAITRSVDKFKQRLANLTK